MLGARTMNNCLTLEAIKMFRSWQKQGRTLPPEWRAEVIRYINNKKVFLNRYKLNNENYYNKRNVTVAGVPYLHSRLYQKTIDRRENELKMAQMLFRISIG